MRAACRVLDYNQSVSFSEFLAKDNFFLKRAHLGEKPGRLHSWLYPGHLHPLCTPFWKVTDHQGCLHFGWQMVVLYSQYLHVKIYFTPKNPAVLSPDTWADSMGLWFERKTWIKMCQIFSKWLEKVEMGESIQEDWKSDELRSSNLSVWVAASIAI